MSQIKNKNRIDEKKTENRQSGEFGVPEAPPAGQSKDPDAGLHVDDKKTVYTPDNQRRH